MKINNICDYKKLDDCGIPSKITTMDARKINNFTTTMNTLVGFNEMFNGSAPSQIYSKQLNTRAAAFETANGESVVVYYNPNCRSDIAIVDADWTQPYMCANFVYDLNGTKGPNTMGKDIGFITVMYPSDPVVVAPMPEPISTLDRKQHTEATRYCTNQNNDGRLPSRDELMAMFYNRSLIGGFELQNPYFWSSTIGEKPDTAYHVRFNSGSRHLANREKGRYNVWCIKR